MAEPKPAENQSTADLDYVKRQLLLNTLGHDMRPGIEAAQKKVAGENQQWLNTLHRRAGEGYHLLMKELVVHAKEGVVTISDEIGPVSIEKCQIDAHAQECLKSPKKLQELQASRGESLQKIFGYQKSAMLTLYELSKKLLTEKRNDDAMKAFSFLCAVNPRVSSFWIGLGLVFENAQSWPEAIDSFQIAAAAVPSDFDGYLGVIRCCDAIKEYGSAKELLETQSNNEVIKDQVQDAFAYIRSKEVA